LSFVKQLIQACSEEGSLKFWDLLP